MRAATTVRKGIEALPVEAGSRAQTAGARVAASGRVHSTRRYTERQPWAALLCVRALPGETEHAASQAKSLKAPSRLPTLAPRADDADPVAVPALPSAAYPASRLSELRPLSRPRSGRHRVARGPVASVALCFPGQGSQAAGMADGLIDLPIAAGDARRGSERCGLDLRAALSGDDEHLRPTEIAQPALLLVECALRSALPATLDVVAVAGHSVGEYAAAVAAHALATLRCDASRHRAGEGDGSDARGHDVRAHRHRPGRRDRRVRRDRERNRRGRRRRQPQRARTAGDQRFARRVSTRRRNAR